MKFCVKNYYILPKEPKSQKNIFNFEMYLIKYCQPSKRYRKAAGKCPNTPCHPIGDETEFPSGY
jgi:hypothetical protein